MTITSSQGGISVLRDPEFCLNLWPFSKNTEQVRLMTSFKGVCRDAGKVCAAKHFPLCGTYRSNLPIRSKCTLRGMQAYLKQLDTSSVLPDRFWSILCVFVAFNSHPGQDPILSFLRMTVMNSAILVNLCIAWLLLTKLL
jgi:hypothetical protein